MMPRAASALALLALVAVVSTASASISCGGGAAYCSDSSTCCRTAQGSWSCCPIPEAICCDDHIHCCPSAYPVCVRNACESADGLSRIPTYTKYFAQFSEEHVDPTLQNMTLHALENPASPKGQQHCEQLIVPGGKSSPFWADEGWRYNPPYWTDGPCPTYFNFLNKQQFNLDGFHGVVWADYGVHVQVDDDHSTEEELAGVETPTVLQNMTLHALENPASPKGQQHCEQLIVPGGKSSPFWADEGWRYNPPYWTDGPCPSYFNFLNKQQFNLDGFHGVVWADYGVHVQVDDDHSTEEELEEAPEARVADAIAPYPIHASCRLTWYFDDSQCASVASGIAKAAASMAGLSACGSSEKCGYSVLSNNATYFQATHETPKHHYVDDLSMSFTQTGASCQVDAYSTSTIWYAILDDGTNYCNLANLAAATELPHTVSVSDHTCTQYSSANCQKY